MERNLSPELTEVLEQLEALNRGTKDFRGDTRERLLDAAIEHFADEGFAATSVRALSSAVGITAAGLYAHFPSKEAIMAAALSRAYCTFLEFVFTADGRSDTELGILDICARHMRFQIERRTMAASSDLLLSEKFAGRYLDAETLIVVRTAQRLYFNRVRNAVAQARGASDLDASLEAEAILSLCDSVAVGPRAKPLRDSGALIDSYLEIIARMLCMR